MRIASFSVRTTCWRPLTWREKLIPHYQTLNCLQYECFAARPTFRYLASLRLWRSSKESINGKRLWQLWLQLCSQEEIHWGQYKDLDFCSCRQYSWSSEIQRLMCEGSAISINVRWILCIQFSKGWYQSALLHQISLETYWSLLVHGGFPKLIAYFAHAMWDNSSSWPLGPDITNNFWSLLWNDRPQCPCDSTPADKEQLYIIFSPSVLHFTWIPTWIKHWINVVWLISSRLLKTVLNFSSLSMKISYLGEKFAFFATVYA